MKKYEAIKAQTIEELNEKVNEMIETGQWKPLGGIALTKAYSNKYEETYYTYAQAMTRTNDNKQQ